MLAEERVGVGDVLHEPVGELGVQESEVGKEQLLLGAGESLSDRLVEALSQGRSSSAFWARCPNPDAAFQEESDDLGFELPAVVGKEPLGRLRQEGEAPREVAGALPAVLRRETEGEGHPARPR